MERRLAFTPLGDRALEVRFAEEFRDVLPDVIRSWCRALGRAGIAGVSEWVPCYTTVTVSYDPCVVRFSRLCELLAGLPASVEPRAEQRRLLLPVCYGGAEGPDLASVARQAAMSDEEAVRRHCAPSYRVVMIGFMPGFPYLAGLDPRLVTPRLDKPRPRVPAGSVGIGGAQTGVYTLASPGGWQIIGRTPARLFDSRRSPPSLLAPGDEVRFYRIAEEELAALEAEAAAGRLIPRWEQPA